MRHVLTLLVLGFAGCAASDQPPTPPIGSGTCSLTVVVWSTVVQGPVPARGTILGPGATLDFDTRPAPARGATFPALGPGLYKIRVSHRHVGDKLQRVEGAEEVYLEPGAHRGVTVVAVDRGEDIGLVDETPPAAPSSSLPLAAAWWAGSPN